MTNTSVAKPSNSAEVEARMHAMAEKLISWLLIGNGASLVLLYNAVANGGVQVDWGARVVAGIFTVGVVCCFLGYYQMVRGFTVRLRKHRGKVAPEDAKVETDSIAWWATGLFVTSALCFLAGVTSPLFGLLTLDGSN